MPTTYDQIGLDYNLTRQADPFLVVRIYTHLQVKKRGRYLDIGSGTGNYTNALASRGLDIIGIDPSEIMLKKARSLHKNIEWYKGQVESLNLDDESIDGVIACLTIHHWSNLGKGFSELSRVMNSKGRLIIFSSTPIQMNGYWLNHYFPKMMQASIEVMPSFGNISAVLSENNFKVISTETYSVQESLRDNFLYKGKHDPGFYLDPEMRAGISSFASIVSENELNEGIHALEQDILNGDVAKIIQDYKNDLGDYMFIIAERHA